MKTFLFVGERPSHLAVRIGASWQNGRLAGKTLRDALLAAGLDPSCQRYTNVWDCPCPCRRDAAAQERCVRRLARWRRRGYTVVGLGRLVQAFLSSRAIEHVAVIHPAARGWIRKRHRYQRHVKRQLAGL